MLGGGNTSGVCGSSAVICAGRHSRVTRRKFFQAERAARRWSSVSMGARWVELSRDWRHCFSKTCRVFENLAGLSILRPRNRSRTWFGIRRQDQRRARWLHEIEIVDQVAELRHVLAHARPRIGAPIGLGIQPLSAEK